MPKAKDMAPKEAGRQPERTMPSKRQQAIIDYVRAFQSERGYPPSRAEIARKLKMPEANIHHYLVKLAARGWMRVDPRVQRGIVLLREGVPVIDAASGEGLDESDLDRPRVDGMEAVFGERPDLLVRVGNNAMAEAGVCEGDLVALARGRAPEDGDLVAAQIRDKVEMRRFVQTDGGDVLEAEPERWEEKAVWRTPAAAEDVTLLGVEIASMTTAGSRKLRRKERKRMEKSGRGSQEQ